MIKENDGVALSSGVETKGGAKASYFSTTLERTFSTTLEKAKGRPEIALRLFYASGGVGPSSMGSMGRSISLSESGSREMSLWKS